MIYKGFEVDDAKVDELVEKLGCSIVEACECILDDEGKIETPREEVAPQKRRYEKSEKARKKTTKERKVDAVKLHFLNEVSALIEDIGATVTNRKTETEVTFTYEGETYTFKLTKHRPPKE